ncbi:MAG: 2OG-Fe(II) oxygenase [Usitatibacter sp.]
MIDELAQAPAQAGASQPDGVRPLWPVSTHAPALVANDDLSIPLVFGAAFSGAECLALRDLHARRPAQLNSLLVPIEDYRHAQTWYLEPEEAAWAFERLAAVGQRANRRYRLEVAAICEPLLLVRYAIGGHFSWHPDTGTGILSMRKISISIQLSDPSDYDGGALEFSNMGEASLARGIGTAIAFPSHFSHRVGPVTRGERWSLVGWIHGPALR